MVPLDHAQRLLRGWSELNLFLTRCHDSEVLLPLLRVALEQKVRWAVVERIWQRYQRLRRHEECAMLKIGVLPRHLKELSNGDS